MTRKRTKAELVAPPDLAAWRLDVESDSFVVFAWSAEIAADTCARLTAAEREVHDLVVNGYSNAEIAQRRGTSRHTVINQISSIFQKLGVRSRWELLARAR